MRRDAQSNAPAARTLALPALGVLLFVAPGCTHRGGAGHATAAVAADSLSGVVSVTGSALEQQIVLRTAIGVTRLLTDAADSAALSRLSGVEVLARGRNDGPAFRVSEFTAQKVDGHPVVDGVLRRDGDRLMLDTATGRIALGSPPVAFRSLIGARVWISGPLETGPLVYGVIAPPP